jgi:acetyl esterase/lipase
MTQSAINPLDLVDSELRPTLDFMLQFVPQHEGEVTQADLDAIRVRSISMQKPFLDAPCFEQKSIPNQDAPDVIIYVINGDAGIVRPAILHMHGGGFVAGTAAGSVADLQVIAKALDCVVVTVEYRLAPETDFRGSLEDNYAALAWLHQNTDALGVDPSRIAVMGESAGGGHAAILALAARDRGEYPICFQALTYPMLDDRTGSSVTPPSHVGTYVWRTDFNIAGWTAFLGQPAGGAEAPSGAVPARVDDLSGLPATFIGTGSLDLFVVEDLEYSRRLIEAGVPTELHIVPGAFHGFEAIVIASSASRRYRLTLFNALARAFGRPEMTVPPDAVPLNFTPPPGASLPL